ncbi:hypothetical protein ACU686_30660 [Yinghuangia aomiensis]
MKARRAGVDDLGHVLPGDVEDLGILVLVEEALHFVGERALVGSQFKVHGNAPEGARAGTDEWCTYAGHHGNLTDSQVNVAPAQDQIQHRRIDLGRKIENRSAEACIPPGEQFRTR